MDDSTHFSQPQDRVRRELESPTTAAQPSLVDSFNPIDYIAETGSLLRKTDSIKEEGSERQALSQASSPLSSCGTEENYHRTTDLSRRNLSRESKKGRRSLKSSGKPWERADLEKLKRLRESGKSWTDLVAEDFPFRSETALQMQYSILIGRGLHWKSTKASRMSEETLTAQPTESHEISWDKNRTQSHMNVVRHKPTRSLLPVVPAASEDPQYALSADQYLMPRSPPMSMTMTERAGNAARFLGRDDFGTQDGRSVAVTDTNKRLKPTRQQTRELSLLEKGVGLAAQTGVQIRPKNSVISWVATPKTEYSSLGRSLDQTTWTSRLRATDLKRKIQEVCQDTREIEAREEEAERLRVSRQRVARLETELQRLEQELFPLMNQA